MKRDEILDEALGLLLNRGVKRFSATELAERLGVVKSALYFHFPKGKASIVDAVFAREEAKVLQAMEQAATSATSCREKLRALAAAKLGSVVNLARLFRVSASVSGELAAYFRACRERFAEAERRLLERVLGEGMAAGEVRALDLPLVAAAVQAALLEVTQSAVLRADVSAEALSDLLADILFSGIAAGGER